MSDELTGDTAELADVTSDPVGDELAPVDADEPEDDDPDEVEPEPNREAAKYRRQLRQAETERDALAEQVAVLQREQIADYVRRELGISVEGFWASGAELESLLAEDGRIDPDAVRAAGAAAVTSLGLSKMPRSPRPNPQQGSGGSSDRRPDFLDVLSKENRTRR